MLYLSSLNPHIGEYGDNAFVLSAANSLAQDGSYTYSYMPYSIPVIHYTPIFPLLLMPLIFLFGYNIILLKLIPLILGLLSILIFYSLIKQFTDKKTTLIITLIVALNPLILIFSHSLLTEIPYLFFSLLALYYINKYDKSSKYLILASLFLLLSYFTRAMGLSLIVATGLLFLTKKKFKELITIMSIVILPVILWIIRSTIVKTKFSLGESAFILFNDSTNSIYSSGLPYTSFWHFITNVFSNIYSYLGPAILTDINKVSGLSFGKLSLILALFGLILWSITLFGVIKSYFKHRSILEYYFIVYLAIVMLWNWQSIRFLIPIIPLILYYFVIGLKSIKINKKIFHIIIIFILAVSLIGSVFEVTRQHKDPYYGEDWEDLYQMGLWVKENIPENSILLSRKPAMVYLWSGEQTFGYPYNSKTYQFIIDNKINYIILDSFKWTETTKNFLKPVIEQNKEDFKLIHQIGETKLYKFKKNVR